MPVIFAALSPEAASAMMLAGPGPAPMTMTADAYAAIAEALTAAAGLANGSASSMDWNGGHSADKAKSAFAKHAAWLQEQATLAATAAAQATVVAAANAAAVAEMADIAAELVVQHGMEVAGTAASAVMPGAGAPIVAAAELYHLELSLRAAAVMSGYEAVVLGNTNFVPPTPPPTIATPGGGLLPTRTVDTTGFVPGGLKGATKGLTDAATTATQTVSDTTQAATEATQTATETATDAAQTATDASQAASDAASNASDVANAGDPMSASPDGGAGGNGGGDQSSLLGTSQTSPTLSGLSGGMGSMVGLGMYGGGFGAMSGASTGFRMPSNWSAPPKPGLGAPGGVPRMPLPGESGPMAPPVRQAPRGAMAPTAQRKRERDKDAKSEKVFIPGEPQEVPVLEQPPAVGVIEYVVDDDDSQTESQDVPVYDTAVEFQSHVKGT